MNNEQRRKKKVNKQFRRKHLSRNEILKKIRNDMTTKKKENVVYKDEMTSTIRSLPHSFGNPSITPKPIDQTEYQS